MKKKQVLAVSSALMIGTTTALTGLPTPVMAQENTEVVQEAVVEENNTLKYIIASTCSHCLLKVTSLSNYIEYIFSEYSKNNLRLIRRLFPHQITYGQLSLLVNFLSLF